MTAEHPAATPLAHGERVVIVADWHPWKGSTGTLEQTRPSSKFPWRVVLDDTGPMPIKAAVDESEVRRV